MTNAEIITREAISLMEKGIIAGTMTKFTDENGEEVEMKLPEEIHTFDQWKKQGRIVKKGEHGVAKFAVWSPTKKTQKLLDENDGKLDETKKKEARMYMRTASWFTKGQTVAITEKSDEPKKSEKPKKSTTSTATKEPKKTAEEKPKKSEAKPTKNVTEKNEKKPKSDKNPYKSAISALHKATLKKNANRHLFYARHGKNVYFSDTLWTVLKVSLTDYNKYFIGSKEYYVKLDDNDAHEVYLGELRSSNCELGKNFEDFLKKNQDEHKKTLCAVTDYTEEQTEGKRTRIARALTCGNRCIAVNDEFLKAPPDEKWYSEDTFDVTVPIVSNRAAALPIRTERGFTTKVCEFLGK